MVHCGYCQDDVDIEVDDANGFSCCVQCGRVLEDAAFSSDVVFQKDAGGESAVVGQFVSESGVARGIGRIHGGRVYAYQADSHEKAQQRGRHEIAHLVDQLSVRPREETVESAHRLYKLALERGFTRGRRTNQVAAACLYLVCRQDSKPFLLIDFSDALQVNVFTLGAVFLQLAKLLRLTEHPMFSKPVDPSLYIHRFADRLNFGRAMNQVANTALRLVASMKRDWIQTGRRPSGICGAAIYIAAHIHGFEKSIRDVVSVVHIGEHTLSKRLYEFSSTTASMYTADEFEERAKQIDHEEAERMQAALPEEQPVELLESTGCEHLRTGEAHFAHGMCRVCYVEFIESTGGVYDGANPPAFERARRKEEETLALEGPEDEEEQRMRDEAAEEFEQEELAIAADMCSVFHRDDLQQFKRFLPSTAEEAEAEAVAAAAAKAPTEPRAKKRRRAATAADGEQQQQEQGAGGAAGSPASQEAADTQLHTQQAQQDQTQAEQQQAAGLDVRQQGEGAASPEGAAAAAGVGVGPSQLSDQTGAAGAQQTATQQTATQAGAAAGRHEEEEPGAGGVAPAAGTHSQRSEQTAAAAGGTAAQAGPDQGAHAGGRDAGQDEGAIVAVPEGRELAVVERPEGDGPDTLSDIEDDDVDMYLADEEEVKCKEEIWNMMNREWLEKQAAKKAAQEAAEKIAADNVAAQEAAEAAGIQYKRTRGRPVGSKTKSQRQDLDLPPAETAQEAARRMLDHRKLSSKINYSALADLFAEPGSAADAGETPTLAAEALEGEEDDDGRGADVRAALQERQAEQEAEEQVQQARQRAALEKERQKMAGRAGAGGKRVGGLGLGLASVGAGRLGGGPLSPRSRRAGGLGSLRDSNFRSQLTSSQQGGGVAGGGTGGAVSTKKTVRFAS